jgi:hypothetical protein
MIEVMKQALEACERLYIPDFTQDDSPINNAIKALRLAINAHNMASHPPEQETVPMEVVLEMRDYIRELEAKVSPHPPKREWVGLTEEDRQQCWAFTSHEAMRNAEAKLKEKNHG